PSLRNIFKEMQRDRGVPVPRCPELGGRLVAWATHGVLLLNTCLTVEEGRPASHSGRGWEVPTQAVLGQLGRSPQTIVFLSWGAHARGKRGLVGAGWRRVLVANHPSPLSAPRPPLPFIGCGHFGQARAWREEWRGKATGS